MAEHPGLFGRVGGGLSSLFGGRADPSLSPEANRRATSDALVASGLATLMAEGPGGVSPTTLQALAFGVTAGREAGRETRAAETDKQKLAQLKSAIDEGELDSRDLFLRAVSIGDLDSATLLGQLARAEGGRAQPAIRFRQGTGPEGPGTYRVASDGSLLNKILDPSPRGSGGQRFGPDKVYRSAEDGKRFVGVFDAEANEGRGGIIRVPGVIPDTSVAERTQEGLGQVGLVAQQALAPLLPVLATLRTDFASNSDSFFISTGAFAATTDEQQIAMSLADTFLNVTVRWLSGAQMTDQERTNYRRAMIPRAFESDFSIRVKAIMQENIARAMAAGVWQGEPTVDEDGNEIADVDNVIAWTTQAQVEAIQQVIAEMQAGGQGGPTLQDIIDAGGSN